jgi:hypothetical protein
MAAQKFHGTSTTIRLFSYTPATKSMTITFAGGRRRDYEDVPQTVAWGLRGASDKGDYYRSRIRNRFRPVAD